MASVLRSVFLKTITIFGLVLLGASVYPILLAGWDDPLEYVSWFLYGCFVFVMLLRASRLESRNQTLELFFLALFFFGLMGEVLRTWFFAASHLQLGATIKIGLVRGIYAFRVVAVLSLFVSTLYLSGWSFRRSSRVVPILVALALSVAWILPISSEVRQWNGLYQLGVEELFQSALIFFTVLSLVARVSLTLYMPEKGRWYAELLLGFGVACWIGLLYGNPLLFLPPLVLSIFLFLRMAGDFYRGI